MGYPREGHWRPPRGPYIASEDFWRTSAAQNGPRRPQDGQENPRMAQKSPRNAQTAFSYEVHRADPTIL
eukprot:3192016-Pyramimonas_sp.AAC.1